MLKNCWVRFSARNTSQSFSNAESYRFYEEIHPLSIAEELHEWANETIGQYREHWQFIEKNWEVVDKLPKEIWQQKINDCNANIDWAVKMLNILKETPHD